MKEVLETIRRETKPIEGHSDPKAIEDCWDEVFSRLSDLQAVADKLYKAIVKIGDDEDVFFGDSAVEALSAYEKLMEQK